MTSPIILGFISGLAVSFLMICLRGFRLRHGEDGRLTRTDSHSGFISEDTN